MSDFLDRFGHQLQRAEPRRRIVAPRRRGLAVAIASLLIAAPAVAVVGPWHPSLGRSGVDDPVAVDESPVPPAALQAFAVLRREQTAADRERTAPLLRAVGAGNQVDRVQTSGIRAVGDGWALVPARSMQTGPSMKADEDVLCLTDGTTIGCAPTASVVERGLEVVSASAAAGTQIVGLVPDGIEAVRFTPSSGRAVESQARSNLFSLSAAELAPPRRINAPPGYNGPSVIDGPPLPVAGTVQWLDGGGKPAATHRVGA